MTEEDIEAEWWAYHYQESKASEEYDDDNPDAANDYLAQITREAEEAEAAEAASAAAAAAGVEKDEAVDPGDWGDPE